MRCALPLVMACVCMLVSVGACEAPAAPPPVGAALVKLPAAKPEPHLPDAVVATVDRLREIAATGSVRDMVNLAEQTADFRSNLAGLDHLGYWTLKLRTGDWPMAHAEKVLEYPYAIAETRRGKVYIWPRLATLRGEDLTPIAAREIDRLLGPGQAAGVARGAGWPGYVLGIAEDGTWLYFLSGAG